MLVRNPRVWLPALLSVTLIVILTLHNTDILKDKPHHQDVVLENVRIPHAAVNTIWDHGTVLQQDRGNVVSNSTLGFEKVFAINLPVRTDKRDSILLASKLTGFDIEYINGVDPSTIADKTLPAKYTGGDAITGGVLGCWRAHMNFIAKVVQENLASALVLEDDVDWDVRLLTQLKDFAVMSSAILNSSVTDSTKMRFENIERRSASEQISPYGDNWDVLFLGNCGVDIDTQKPHVVHAHDNTVPDLQHLKIYGDPNGLRLNPYPSHARLAGHAIEQTCTYAYAVTQKAARRILLDLGLERLDRPIDHMLRDWCEGKFAEQGPPRTCIGVLPTLFDSYRREGAGEADSDIDGDKAHIGFREKAHTLNIRKSTRMNLRKLMDGEAPEDQYPDGKFG
ncbi:hypothetical protein LTS08_000964 [Lithohypha guttulata]|uniref:uncharacterized protein n=1 Tax=Lithohypha guttulata TaxID=1690604 RepID=UPI002DDF10A3|nr:hypothetical protein LTR51_006424 [Lithohypha guttulata]KAK5106841.1 hypothetical protein LTS08_000964 [Lithohypha guttulata]